MRLSSRCSYAVICQSLKQAGCFVDGVLLGAPRITPASIDCVDNATIVLTTSIDIWGPDGVCIVVKGDGKLQIP